MNLTPLIPALLLKFSVFNDPETQKDWLLPSEFPPRIQGSGRYRLLRKSAIEELGERTQHKRWVGVVPRVLNEYSRKRVIWRDGMAEYIESRLREEAWKSLEGMEGTPLFRVELKDGLGRAVLGEKIAIEQIVEEKDTSEVSKIDSEQEVSTPTALGPEVSQEPEAIPTEDKGNGTTVPTENPRLVCEIPTNSSEDSNATEAKPAETNGDESQLTTIEEETPHILGIIYLSPSDATENWEFKLIPVENQVTPTLIFNFRRLFPLQAEEYMSRLVGSDNAVAITSSDASAFALKEVVRLALYLGGNGSDSPDGK